MQNPRDRFLLYPRRAGRGSHLSKLKKCVRRIHTRHSALRARPPHTHMHQTRRAHTRSRCDATCEISPTHAQARAQGTDRAETFRPLKPLRWKLSTTEGRGRLRIPRRLAPLPRPVLCPRCSAVTVTPCSWRRSGPALAPPRPRRQHPSAPPPEWGSLPPRSSLGHTPPRPAKGRA